MGAAVARAIERFNAGDWHAALDEFEVPYHEVRGRERDLWLALVRASAALHHLERGQPLSARRLFLSARDLLERFAPAAAGLDLASLLEELDRAFAPLLAAEPGEAALVRVAARPRLARVGEGGR